jgi:plastocyanin
MSQRPRIRALQRSASPRLSWAAIAAALAIFLAAVAALVPRGAAADTVTIPSGDNWFCGESYELGDCQTVIQAGDSVTWTYPAGGTVHTTTECGASCDSPTGTPLWDSGYMSPGHTFTWTFDAPGTYRYYCSLHPFDMRGTIVAQAPPAPAPTETPVNTPGEGAADPTAPESSLEPDGVALPASTGPAAALPSSGGAPADGAPITAMILAGATLTLLGVSAILAGRRSG